MAGPDDRLLLGPWDHGARTNGSPWRDKPAPEFPVLGEVLRFFDQHLMGLDTGIRDEAPIHYLTLHEEKWKAATSWPPVPKTTRYHLDANGALTTKASASASKVDYAVHFTTNTGRATRYERLGAFAVLDYYPDWSERQDAMASFTTAPFDEPVELTGHAVVSLRISTSERDGSVFAYLSEIEADGRARFVTEGALRMLHRKLATPPESYNAVWPWRTFHRADAKLMQPGVAEELRFALVPVSWRFARGSRLRLSIAGADGQHFAQVPHGRPPKFQIVVGGAEGSFVDLPLGR
jgi:putative CocE/NonD family hydrolase